MFRNTTKNMYSVPKMETMLSNVFYSISMNPENQYDNIKNSSYLKRDEYVIETMCKNLVVQEEVFDYYLLPECQNGRIHFHGYVLIKDILKFDMLVLPFWKQLCTYEIDCINDPEIWYKYVTKNIKLWKDYKYCKIKRGIKLDEIMDFSNIKYHKDISSVTADAVTDTVNQFSPSSHEGLGSCTRGSAEVIMESNIVEDFFYPKKRIKKTIKK